MKSSVLSLQWREVENLQLSKKLKKINSSKKPRKYSRQRSKESKFTTSLKLLQVSQVTTSPFKERKSTVLLLRKKVSKSLQRKKVYRVTSMEGSLPCNFKGRKSAVFKKNNVYCLLSTLVYKSTQVYNPTQAYKSTLLQSVVYSQYTAIVNRVQSVSLYKLGSTLNPSPSPTTTVSVLQSPVLREGRKRRKKKREGTTVVEIKFRSKSLK